MRILFHGPGLAAFRPALPLPHLLGVQPSVTDRLGAMNDAHWLTGNRGNIIHAEAPAKILRKAPRRSAYGNVAVLKKSLGDSYAGKIARNFDIIVISMANFIRPNHDGTALFDALRALDDRVPFVVLGCGLQGKSTLDDMMPGNRDLIALFNERAAVFGVRGEATKEWLDENGFHNATVLGCPSLYSYPHSILSIDGKTPRSKGAQADVMTAGHLSIRNGQVVPRGKELLKAFHGVKASYVLQDEFLHYTELFDEAGVYQEGSSSIDGEVINDWLKRRFGIPASFERYYYFNEAGAWRQAALRHDVFIGDRFHGGVAAMQAGVPAIFLKHDNRVSELTAHFGLPGLTTKEFMDKGLAATIEEYLSKENLEYMKKCYHQRYSEFCAALAPHDLVPELKLSTA